MICKQEAYFISFLPPVYIKLGTKHSIDCDRQRRSHKFPKSQTQSLSLSCFTWLRYDLLVEGKIISHMNHVFINFLRFLSKLWSCSHSLHGCFDGICFGLGLPGPSTFHHRHCEFVQIAWILNVKNAPVSGQCILTTFTLYCLLLSFSYLLWTTFLPNKAPSLHFWIFFNLSGPLSSIRAPRINMSVELLTRSWVTYQCCLPEVITCRQILPDASTMHDWMLRGSI